MATNLIRTIQAGEKTRWMDLLFVEGPHEGDWVPLYPFQLPFPFRLGKDVAGGFAYLIYGGYVIAYGRIDSVVENGIMHVGTEGQPVQPGQSVVIDGTYVHMPDELQHVHVRGFTGVRYTPHTLHALDANALRAALRDAGINVR
jgi:hypothetical protein